jgi:hypothetical protein
MTLILEPVDRLVEQMKQEHLIYHDPHKVLRVKQLILESMWPKCELPEPPAEAAVKQPARSRAKPKAPEEPKATDNSSDAGNSVQ